MLFYTFFNHLGSLPEDWTTNNRRANKKQQQYRLVSSRNPTKLYLPPTWAPSLLLSRLSTGKQEPEEQTDGGRIGTAPFSSDCGSLLASSSPTVHSPQARIIVARSNCNAKLICVAAVAGVLHMDFHCFETSIVSCLSVRCASEGDNKLDPIERYRIGIADYRK
jgi:hypothetical protein